MSIDSPQGGLLNPVTWPKAGVVALGVLTSLSVLAGPVAFTWFVWVTFYPGPLGGTTTGSGTTLPPADILASLPAMTLVGLLSIAALVIWLLIVAVNGRSVTTKALWALAVLAGGGLAQAIAYFLFVWNPWHAVHEPRGTWVSHL